MMPTSERPIFIVGVHRSGTTLLRYMLNSSPRIYIPPESDFIPRFFGHNPGGELSERRIAGILDTIFGRYRFSKEWQGPIPRSATLLQHISARTPAAFLEALYSAYARQNGAVRWGDKTPIYTSYMDLIDNLFPEAQFIHIIRDGRDVAVSMLDKWGQREIHVDIYFGARNWLRRIRQAQASGIRLGSDRYYELRYESLVEDPEGTLQPLCAWLRESYVPDMAQPERLAQEQIPAGHFHAPLREPPSPARIGRWKEDLSPADQRLVQHVAGELLIELGYHVEDLGNESPRERARRVALAAKYATLQAGRRVLQAMGILPPI